MRVVESNLLNDNCHDNRHDNCHFDDSCHDNCHFSMTVVIKEPTAPIPVSLNTSTLHVLMKEYINIIHELIKYLLKIFDASFS